MNKNTTIAALVLIVGGILFFNLRNGGDKMTGGVIDTDTGRKFLIVGESWPPMEFEQDGIAKGAHVEVVDMVMERLDIPYEIKFVPWARALKMAESGEADALLSAAYSAERDEWAFYTEDQKLAENKVLPKAYLDAMSMVFFIKKRSEGILMYDSFKQIASDNYKVGLDAGYAYVDDVLEAGWDAEYYHTIPDNFQALNEGTTDMYLQDKIAGLQMIKELGLEDEITYIDKPVMTFIYYLPFSENSDYPNIEALWEQSLVELEKIQKSGIIDEIYERYMEDD